jgi:hypothetical protein
MVHSGSITKAVGMAPLGSDTEADHAKGNVDGDTWTWQSEARMGSQSNGF